MTIRRIAGVVLLVLGLVALAYRGFGFTDRDTVVDVGPLEVTREDREFIPVPPLLGVAAVIGGAALIFVPGRRRS
jgi:hypothetical protein